MSKTYANVRWRKDKRWEARLKTGRKPDGRIQYKYFYGHTSREADSKRTAYMLENMIAVEKGEPVFAEPLTFSEVTEKWLEDRAPLIKESTAAHYQMLCRTYILPTLGPVLMKNLTTETVDDLLKHLLSYGRAASVGGLSPKTVTDIRTVIRGILRYADRKGYAHQVREQLFIPRPAHRSIEVLSREEQNKLESWLLSHDSPICTGILLTLYTGLRIGEICALTWGDLNFTENLVYVSKTLLRIQNSSNALKNPHTDDQLHAANRSGTQSKTGMAGQSRKTDSPRTKLVIETPKTDCSVRTIPIPSHIRDYLFARRCSPDCYVITGTTACKEPRLVLLQYKSILKKAGISQHTYHALRHTFATRCVELGFDAKTLSELLGHANVTTTFQLYVHPTLEHKREVMNQLSSVTTNISSYQKCSENSSSHYTDESSCDEITHPDASGDSVTHSDVSGDSITHPDASADSVTCSDASADSITCSDVSGSAMPDMQGRTG